MVPQDADYFSLFPMGGASPTVPQAPSPAAAQPTAAQPSLSLLLAPPPVEDTATYLYIKEVFVSPAKVP